MKKKVMIVTGEASGDLHGSNLIKAVHDISPDISFYGIGGPLIRETGAEILIESQELAVVGISEVIPSVGKIFAALNLLKKRIKQDRPSLLVCIDLPDFNLMVAKFAKKMNLPVLYYISPQVWAWRKGRIKKIARLVDKMAVVFPFEAPLYENAGLDVRFVGHPLIDAVNPDRSLPDIKKDLGIDDEKKVIGLLPGSRLKEVKSLLPIMLEAAEIMASRSPEFQFILPMAHTIDKSLIDGFVNSYNAQVTVVEDMTYEVMKGCDLLFAASGTATLEAAIIGTPMVVLYKLSPFSYGLAKYLSDMEYISLPNIVAGRKIVDELIQDDADPARLVEEAFKLLFGSGFSDQMRQDLKNVREKLGGAGASARTARLLVEMLSQGE